MVPLALFDQVWEPHAHTAIPTELRLLTLARTVKTGSGIDDHIQCLAVTLSARDKAFIISVQETPMARAGGNKKKLCTCPNKNTNKLFMAKI